MIKTIDNKMPNFGETLKIRNVRNMDNILFNKTGMVINAEIIHIDKTIGFICDVSFRILIISNIKKIVKEIKTIYKVAFNV
jgi:hypothetical protein